MFHFTYLLLIHFILEYGGCVNDTTPKAYFGKANFSIVNAEAEELFVYKVVHKINIRNKTYKIDVVKNIAVPRYEKVDGFPIHYGHVDDIEVFEDRWKVKYTQGGKNYTNESPTNCTVNKAEALAEVIGWKLDLRIIIQTSQRQIWFLRHVLPPVKSKVVEF